MEEKYQVIIFSHRVLWISESMVLKYMRLKASHSYHNVKHTLSSSNSTILRLLGNLRSKKYPPSYWYTFPQRETLIRITCGSCIVYTWLWLPWWLSSKESSFHLATWEAHNIAPRSEVSHSVSYTGQNEHWGNSISPLPTSKFHFWVGLWWHCSTRCWCQYIMQCNL